MPVRSHIYWTALLLKLKSGFGWLQSNHMSKRWYYLYFAGCSINFTHLTVFGTTTTFF